MWEIEGRYRGDGYGEREEIEPQDARSLRVRLRGCAARNARRIRRAPHGRLYVRRLRRTWRGVWRRRVRRAARSEGNGSLFAIPLSLSRIRRGEKSPLFKLPKYGQRKTGCTRQDAGRHSGISRKERMVVLEEDVRIRRRTHEGPQREKARTSHQRAGGQAAQNIRNSPQAR